MATATLTKKSMAAAMAATETDAAESSAEENVQAANGHLTKADEYRREVSSDLAYARRELRESHQEVQNLTADLKDAKDRMKAAQIRVNSLCELVIDIETGNYTPAMFDCNGAAKGSEALPDEGAAMPIGKLAEYGLSAKQCEKLAESKLEIKTVGDLEKAISTNEWWHRDVDGMGEKTIDKVTEALLEFRLTYPVPVKGEQEVELSIDGGASIKMPAT